MRASRTATATARGSSFMSRGASGRGPRPPPPSRSRQTVSARFAAAARRHDLLRPSTGPCRPAYSQTLPTDLQHRAIAHTEYTPWFRASVTRILHHHEVTSEPLIRDPRPSGHIESGTPGRLKKTRRSSGIGSAIKRPTHEIDHGAPRASCSGRRLPYV